MGTDLRQVWREGGAVKQRRGWVGIRFLFPPPRSRLLLVEGKCFWIRDRKTPLQGREGSAHRQVMAKQLQGDGGGTVAPRLGSLGGIRQESRWGEPRWLLRNPWDCVGIAPLCVVADVHKSPFEVPGSKPMWPPDP